MASFRVSGRSGAGEERRKTKKKKQQRKPPSPGATGAKSQKRRRYSRGEITVNRVDESVVRAKQPHESRESPDNQRDNRREWTASAPRRTYPSSLDPTTASTAEHKLVLHPANPIDGDASPGPSAASAAYALGLTDVARLRLPKATPQTHQQPTRSFRHQTPQLRHAR